MVFTPWDGDCNSIICYCTLAFVNCHVFVAHLSPEPRQGSGPVARQRRLCDVVTHALSRNIPRTEAEQFLSGMWPDYEHIHV